MSFKKACDVHAEFLPYKLLPFRWQELFGFRNTVSISERLHAHLLSPSCLYLFLRIKRTIMVDAQNLRLFWRNIRNEIFSVL